MRAKRDRPIGSDVVFGLAVGLLMALGYSILALAILMFGGPESFERNGVSFLSVLFAYWVGGPASGVLLGLLKPFTASKKGAMLVGPIIAMPAVAMLGVTIDGFPWLWQAETVFAFVVMCLIFGVYGGYVFGGSTAGPTSSEV